MSEEDTLIETSTAIAVFTMAIAMIKTLEILVKLIPIPQPPQPPQPQKVAPSTAMLITSDNYTAPSPLELPPNPPTVHMSLAKLKVVVAPSTGASADIVP